MDQFWAIPVDCLNFGLELTSFSRSQSPVRPYSKWRVCISMCIAYGVWKYTVDGVRPCRFGAMRCVNEIDALLSFMENPKL